LWNVFVSRLEGLLGEVVELSVLDQFNGKAIYDDDVPDSVKLALGEPVPSVWEAEIGVTLADVAVAETGSLVIAAKQRRTRLNSLAPPVHLALIEPQNTVASLEDAFDRIPAETSVIVSGPSRTADVEGIMVMGVHGPKRLLVVGIDKI